MVQPRQPSDSLTHRSNRVRPSPPPDSVEVEVQQPSQKQEPENVVKLRCGETECTFQVDVYKFKRAANETDSS